MRQETAEAFAAEVLGWLAEDHARIGAFLSWSGESPQALRARIADPGLLLAVIEFLMTDEAQLVEACAALGVAPETPGRARAALPGGADLHWT
ncbi:MAG: DUF3572 domain-containing protein [Rhodobacteraceae bacterium]|nr:DUF3572 domain-containing protein [Paracoccaceae bacterium]